MHYNNTRAYMHMSYLPTDTAFPRVRHGGAVRVPVPRGLRQRPAEGVKAEQVCTTYRGRDIRAGYEQREQQTGGRDCVSKY